MRDDSGLHHKRYWGGANTPDYLGWVCYLWLAFLVGSILLSGLFTGCASLEGPFEPIEKAEPIQYVEGDDTVVEVTIGELRSALDIANQYDVLVEYTNRIIEDANSIAVEKAENENLVPFIIGGSIAGSLAVGIIVGLLVPH